MDVFGHHHVAEDIEAIPLAHLLQCAFEGALGLVAVEQRQPAIATEGEEVVAAELLVAFQMRRHGERVLGEFVRSM